MMTVTQPVKPITRQLLAVWGICSQMVHPFILKHSIHLEAQTVSNPKDSKEIIQKINEMVGMSKDVL